MKKSRQPGRIGGRALGRKTNSVEKTIGIFAGKLGALVADLANSAARRRGTSLQTKSSRLMSYRHASTISSDNILTNVLIFVEERTGFF